MEYSSDLSSCVDSLTRGRSLAVRSKAGPAALVLHEDYALYVEVGNGSLRLWSVPSWGDQNCDLLVDIDAPVIGDA
jgi:hypothetical protein